MNFCLKYADLGMSLQSLWETSNGVHYLSNLFFSNRSIYDEEQVNAMLKELADIVTLPETLDMPSIAEIEVAIPDVKY